MHFANGGVVNTDLFDVELQHSCDGLHWVNAVLSEPWWQRAIRRLRCIAWLIWKEGWAAWWAGEHHQVVETSLHGVRRYVRIVVTYTNISPIEVNLKLSPRGKAAPEE